jgi:hypothetical protein
MITTAQYNTTLFSFHIAQCRYICIASWADTWDMDEITAVDSVHYRNMFVSVPVHVLLFFPALWADDVSWICFSILYSPIVNKGDGLQLWVVDVNMLAFI